MPNIAGVIGLGQAKPKNYENLAMQQLAQANAERARKAKYDKEAADKWKEDIFLTDAMTKDLLPVQIAAASNMSTNLFKEFERIRINNPNGYMVAANQLKNEFKKDIGIMREKAAEYRDLFGRSDLTPQQEEEVRELENRAYGSDYGHFIDWFSTPDNNRVFREPYSELPIVPKVATTDEFNESVKKAFAALEGAQVPSFGVTEIPGEEHYKAYTQTYTTPKSDIESVAQTLWQIPGMEYWVEDIMEGNNQLKPGMTKEEKYPFFVEEVEKRAPVKQTATIKGPSGKFFDFGTVTTEEKAAKLGVEKDVPMVIGGFEQLGLEDEPAEDVRFQVTSPYSIRLKPAKAIITPSNEMIDPTTFKPINTGGQPFTFEGGGIQITPYFKEGVSQIDIDFRSAKPKNQADKERLQRISDELLSLGGLEVDKLLDTEANKDLIEYKMMVPGIATYIKDKKDVKVPINIPFSSVSEAFFNDMASQYELEERRLLIEFFRNAKKDLGAEPVQTQKQTTSGAGRFNK